MKIVSAFELRFPNWETQKTEVKRFLVQYVEMLTTESAVVYEGDGVMMSEDRYLLELAKPAHGGYSASAAKLKFAELLKDPTAIRDKQGGVDRVRVSLDDHVKFINKFSRLKQLIQSEQARKNLSDSDVQNLENRVLSGHDRGFANQDIDMLSMAQRMAKGAGKGATAFDAEHLQMGDLQGLLPEPGSPAPKKKGGNPDADEDSLVLGRFVVSEQG